MGLLASCVKANVDCGKSVYQPSYGAHTPGVVVAVAVDDAAADAVESVSAYSTKGGRTEQSPPEYARSVHVVTSPKMSMNAIVTVTANSSTVVAALNGCPL